MLRLSWVTVAQDRELDTAEELREVQGTESWVLHKSPWEGGDAGQCLVESWAWGKLLEEGSLFSPSMY